MRTLALALVAALPALARGEAPPPPAADDAASRPAPSRPAASPPAATAPEWEDVPSPDAARATSPAQAAPQPAPAKAELPPAVPPYAAPPPPPPPPAPATPAKQRGSWYIGFGLGAGGARLGVDDGSGVAMNGSPSSFNFRVGGTLTPRLLLGFDGGFLAADGDDPALQINTYGIGVMYFPQERGLYLRAAVGESELDRGTVTLASGWHVTGGVGYAFWLGKSFNLTLNLDAQRHTFGDSSVANATAWSSWLGFDWY